MINLGSGKIKDLRLGSEKISKAYLGDKLIYFKNVEEKKVFTTQLKYNKRESEKDIYILEYPENYSDIDIESILIGDEHILKKEDIVSWGRTVFTVSDNSSARNAFIDKGTKVEIHYK